MVVIVQGGWWNLGGSGSRNWGGRFWRGRKLAKLRCEGLLWGVSINLTIVNTLKWRGLWDFGLFWETYTGMGREEIVRVRRF